jgi:osmotically inducible protein OsmC
MASTAKATWNGGLKGGDGTMALGSGDIEVPFTYKSRFEEGDGTNPEELIGAALAGCFTMQLSAYLERDGNTPFVVETDAKVQLRHVDSAPTITRVELATRGRAEGVDQDGFEKTANEAKEACIIARALAGVEEIELVEAKLEE